MDFKNSYRVEAVYFNKLKSDIDIAKSYIAAGATDEARAVLENLVDVDGAVLLLYRNIGECWAELANAIEKTKKELDALRDQMEQYHDELNEKIDEINNYIIRLINALDERLTAAEADIDDLQERMAQAESDIDDLEANKQDKLTAGFGIEIDANNEISVDTDDVQEKLIAGQNITLTPDSTDPTKTVISATGTTYSEGTGIDIDSNNEISVDTTVIQEKLTEGFGIDIDSNNEISVDTDDVQEKLIAGQNITLTPDSTDPTKTVISATDTTYSEGTGIDIDSNNVISADTSVLQEKLVAGSGISIDPNTNEITNTAQAATYSEDYGINIANDNKISFKTPGLDASSANFGSNTFASVTFSKGYQRNTYSGTLNSGNVTFGSQQYLTLNGLGFYANANNQQASTLPSGLILCILSCRVSIWAGTIGSNPKRQYLYIKNTEIPGVIEVSNGAVDFSLAYGENILIPAIYNVRKEFGDIHGQYNMTLRLIPLTTYTDTDILDIINSQKRYLNVALQYNYGTL